jgi:hypothetical protein
LSTKVGGLDPSALQTLFPPIPFHHSVCLNSASSLSMDDEVSQTATATASKSDNVFSKIITRINYLEKSFVTLELGYQKLHEFVNATAKENLKLLQGIENTLKARILLHVCY